MIIDSITFNGEYDLLEIRLNILDEFVDTFVICESTQTFSGNWKPLYWAERDKDRFEKWEHKIKYHIVTEYNNPDILKQIEDRIDYVDQPAFQRAFYQKESIRKVLEELNLDDNDVIYYGDCDEIPKPKHEGLDDKVHKLRQLAYSYYLNNRSPEDWRGTVVTKWKNLKGKCLNDMRANPVESDILNDGGWHFTNIGGLESVMNKLESYDHQEVNISWVKDGLLERIEQNIDYLGRDFKFWKESKDLPEYILKNKKKYKHLWR